MTWVLDKLTHPINCLGHYSATLINGSVEFIACVAKNFTSV